MTAKPPVDVAAALTREALAPEIPRPETVAHRAEQARAVEAWVEEMCGRYCAHGRSVHAVPGCAECDEEAGDG